MRNKLTKKAFQDELNDGDYKHSHANNRYANRKRKYGDYLRAQDPEKFNADYQEWISQRKEPKAK